VCCLGLVEAGMTLCDIEGAKVGTVSRVLAEPSSHDPILEVKTGFLGLGRPLYFPLSLIQGVTGRSAFCWLTRKAIEREYLDGHVLSS